jgi:beta-1,4-mannosyltransferase
LLGLQSLFLLLARTPRADAVLVQNPPGFPTLPAGWLAARIRRSLFIVDWHNFGYAMLAPRLGTAHFMVRMAKRCERGMGRRADANFCVSAAMRDVLIGEFGLPAPVVVHDQPRELPPLLPVASRSAAAHRILARAGYTLPKDAALAVCPTSWTADEDMDLLLTALQLWDAQGPTPPLARLFVLITGRGSLREPFESRISGLKWRRVTLRTAFFDPADYRELLCAAHLGLCLHRSTSGVDLPMKLMDLLGARTPVSALDYGECLTEQIQPGVTALTFRNSQELASRIDELLHGFPGDLQLLERMQRNIEASRTEVWQQTWQREAAPVFHRVLGPA